MKTGKVLFLILALVLGSCSESSQVKTYTVTWKNWDGSVLEVDKNVSEGAYPSYNGYTPTRSDDSQYSYSFNGWYPSLKSVTSNITYTAQFSRSTKSYTVTWKNWDGSVLETDYSVPYGSTPSYNGSTPTKPNDGQYKYSFTGWSPALVSVTQNATYTAQFSKSENYECNNVYHWKNGGNKESHSYKIIERTIDSSVGYGLIVLECEICKHSVKEKCGFHCTIDNYGSVYIDRFYNNYIEGTKDFVVPPEIIINGASIPVERFLEPSSSGSFISANPFSANMPDLENVWLPSTIREGGFANLRKLKTINIEYTKYSGTGNNQFANCSSLEEITLPDTFYKTLSNTFYNCKSLKKVNFNNNPTEIGVYCFNGCVNLEEFVIPSSVTSLGWRVFGTEDSSDVKLKKLYIPLSVSTTGYSVAFGCNLLTIFCEAQTKPSGWNANWNPDNRPVIWGYSN